MLPVHKGTERQPTTAAPGGYVYECAACSGRFTILEPYPPRETEACIFCQARGARRIAREGEQDGPFHRGPEIKPVVEYPPAASTVRSFQSKEEVIRHFRPNPALKSG
jgi:hypothetical protein